MYLKHFEECLLFPLVSMYANDTHAIIALDNINELAQMMKEELQKISEWMKVDRLSSNPKKWVLVHWSSTQD